jgi:hypothetical protein
MDCVEVALMNAQKFYGEENELLPQWEKTRHYGEVDYAEIF